MKIIKLLVSDFLVDMTHQAFSMVHYSHSVKTLNSSVSIREFYSGYSYNFMAVYGIHVHGYTGRVVYD